MGNNTGMIRKIDELGRVVIPKEIRQSQNMNEGDFVDFSILDNGILLSKFEQSCVFCGKTKKLINFKGKLICNRCKIDLTK